MSDAKFACVRVLPYNYSVTMKQDNLSPDGGTYGIDKDDRMQLPPQDDDDSLLAEDDLRSIFELYPDMVCIFDNDSTRFLKVNSVFSQVLGYPEAHLLNNPICTFIHPDDIEPTERIIREKLGQGCGVFGFINRYRKADGSYCWMEWNVRPRPDRGVTYGVARDVTQRRKIEDSLRLSDETLRAFLNAIGESAYIINADGIVLEHNEPFAECLGMTGRSLRGRSLFDLLPSEDIRKRRNRIEEIIKTGRGGHMEDERDGRFVFSSLYLIKNAEGGVVKIAVLGQDITWLRRAEEVMLLNEERLESLLNLSQMSAATEEEIRTYALEEAISLTRSTFGFLFFVNEENGRIEDAIWSREVRQNCPLEGISHASIDSAGFWAEGVRQRRPVYHNAPLNAPDRQKTPSGHVPILRYLSVPVFDADRIVAVAGVANKDSMYDETDAAQLGLYMHTMWAILKQRRAAEVLRRCSMEDPLTGLANRRRFDDAFESEWRRALREKNPLSLLFLDIDFFKKFNDLYGHQAGDDCLRRVADCLKSVLNRAGDLVARYGGEEFVAILPNTELAGAIKIGETMRERVMHLGIPHEESKVAPVVTISIGVVACDPYEGIRSHEILETADHALYEAKREGRNKIRWQVLEKS